MSDYGIYTAAELDKVVLTYRILTIDADQISMRGLDDKVIRLNRVSDNARSDGESADAEDLTTALEKWTELTKTAADEGNVEE